MGGGVLLMICISLVLGLLRWEVYVGCGVEIG